jgi:hypothetical protein
MICSKDRKRKESLEALVLDMGLYINSGTETLPDVLSHRMATFSVIDTATSPNPKPGMTRKPTSVSLASEPSMEAIAPVELALEEAPPTVESKQVGVHGYRIYRIFFDMMKKNLHNLF